MSRRTRLITVARASDDRGDALDGDAETRGSSVSVDTLEATIRGADETEQKKSEEWWSWTKRWAVGDSDEEEDYEDEDGASTQTSLLGTSHHPTCTLPCKAFIRGD